MASNKAFRSNLRHYLSGNLENGRLQTMLRLAMGGSLLLIGLWLAYFAFITISMPYPIEYREGATQVLTRFLLDGKNPWALENQPAAMNNNGIIYNLFVLPLAASYGNTLLVHRVVTFIFLLLCGYLAARTSLASTRDAGPAILCGELVMLAVGARGGLGVFPNSMGTFFFLLGIVVPFSRAFNKRGLIFSALLCLLAFYTKPYFVLSFGIVASYVFIFVSKKKGLLYGALFALTLSASALLMRALFPFYFIYTIFSNASNTARSGGHLLEQLVQLGREFYPSAILAAVITLVGASAMQPGTSTLKGPSSRPNILLPDRPLIPRPMNYFGYVFGCSALAFLTVLGWHRGAYVTYSYQLMLPPFFLWLFGAPLLRNRLALVSIPLLLFNAFSFAGTRFAPSFLEQRNSTDWARLYEYVDGSRHILNTPIVVPEMIRLGMLPINSGKNEYFWNIKPYPDISLLGPDYGTILALREDYENSIQDAYAHSQYDRIITAPKMDFFIPGRLEQNYFRVESMQLSMPQTEQLWRVDIWEARVPSPP